jgi:hypothetical protein
VKYTNKAIIKITSISPSWEDAILAGLLLSPSFTGAVEKTNKEKMPKKSARQEIFNR